MSGIFARFSDAERQIMEKIFSTVTVPAGEFLCKDGEPAKEMHVIISGEVEVLRSKRKKDEFDHVGTIGAGQISGEAALTGVFPRSASLRAKSAAVIMVITKDKLLRFKKEHPKLLLSFYEGIFEQIGERFKTVMEKKTQELF